MLSGSIFVSHFSFLFQNTTDCAEGEFCAKQVKSGLGRRLPGGRRCGSPRPVWAETCQGFKLSSNKLLRGRREKVILNVEKGLEKVIRKVHGPGVPGQAG